VAVRKFILSEVAARSEESPVAQRFRIICALIAVPPKMLRYRPLGPPNFKAAYDAANVFSTEWSELYSRS